MATRRVLLQVGVVLGLALLTAPQGAQAFRDRLESAASGRGDMVVGGGVILGNDVLVGGNFALSASSGPLGENPQGHFTFFINSGPNSQYIQATVTCLAVADNVAAVAAVVTGGAYVGRQLVILIRDSAQPTDSFYFSLVDGDAGQCFRYVADAASLFLPIEAGDLLVHDEQAPEQ